jgi:hypothetical protein
MGVAILNHAYSFNSRTLMKTSVAYSGQGLNVDHYLVLRDKNFKPNDTLPQILGYDFLETKTTLAWYIKHKVNAKNSFKVGFFANAFHVDFYDQAKINSRFDTIAQGILENKTFKTRINTQDRFLFTYNLTLHLCISLTTKWSTNLGLFAQYLTLSNSWAAEPRASLRYQFKPNQSLSLAYGMHSQMQPTYIILSQHQIVLVRDGKVYSNPTKQ